MLATYLSTRALMASIGSIANPWTKMSNRSISLSWRCAFPSNRSWITSRTMAWFVIRQAMILASCWFSQASPNTPPTPTALHLRPNELHIHNRRLAQRWPSANKQANPNEKCYFEHGMLRQQLKLVRCECECLCVCVCVCVFNILESYLLLTSWLCANIQRMTDFTVITHSARRKRTLTYY